MPEDSLSEAHDLYTERLIRSVAHNIGNLVNVISGRLSLLELQEGIGAEALQVIGLMRDRLRKTQGELRHAVRFVSETTKPTSTNSSEHDASVVVHLKEVQAQLPSGIHGLSELEEDVRATSFMSSAPLTAPLTTLHAGLSKLTQDHAQPVWQLTLAQEGLVLTIQAPTLAVPADRRALLEPWFDAQLPHGATIVQKGRLEVAVALGWLEEGGAQISTSSLDGNSLVRAVWQSGNP
jgi:hypothetical protein